VSPNGVGDDFATGIQAATLPTQEFNTPITRIARRILNKFTQNFTGEALFVLREVKIRWQIDRDGFFIVRGNNERGDHRSGQHYSHENKRNLGRNV